MPPYNWIHLESVFWVLGVGLMSAVAIILARGSRALTFTFKKRSEQALRDETHDFGGVVSEQNRPVPVFIWFVGIGYFVWAIAYVVYSGTFGL